VGRPELRLLAVAATADSPAQYVPFMNAVFAAQKLGVTLDACALGEAGSAFLEQGAHLTGGIYTKPCLPSQQLGSISVCTDLSSPQ
jgi:hypothetical protein